MAKTKKEGSKRGAHFKKEVGGKRNWTYMAYFTVLQGKLDKLQIWHSSLKVYRIPVSIDDEEFKNNMPGDIWCPKLGTLDVNEIIDAIYSRSFGFLLSIKKEYPNHTFGFEPFLDWLLRKAGKSGENLDIKNLFLVVQSESSIKNKHTLPNLTAGPITLKRTLIQYKDGDCCMEVECLSIKGLLTRMYIDLDDRSNKYWVQEHYPNVYVQIKAPTDFPWVFFKVPFRGMVPDKRIGFQFHGDSVESVHVEASASD